MDPGANHLPFIANLQEMMSPNDHHHHPRLGLSMEEGGLVVMTHSPSGGSSSSIDDYGSINSIGFGSTTSSSDEVEDASSPPKDGPLYQLSELMAQLPIKRGLSKYYQGKSQSFTSLSSVNSLEDLAKKGHNLPNRLKMKSCKSYSGLEGHSRWCFSPKATISKKTSRGSFSSSSSNLGRRT